MAILFDPLVVQDQARDELLADPVISQFGINVVSADPGDIDTAIEQALERLNIGILILLPAMRASNKSTPGPYFDNIRLVAEIVESSTLNRGSGVNGVDYITAQTLSMMTSAILHYFQPAGIDERFYVTDVAAFPDPAKKYNIWHVELTAKGGVGYPLPQLAPVIASAVAVAGGHVVTLSCATLGASIWYTIFAGNNATYPSPRNPLAKQVYLQYSGILQNPDGTMMLNPDGSPMFQPEGPANFPFFVPTGSTFAARAWLNGYRPPNPDQLVITP